MHAKLREDGNSIVASLDKEALRREGLLDADGNLTGDYMAQVIYDGNAGQFVIDLPDRAAPPAP